MLFELLAVVVVILLAAIAWFWLRTIRHGLAQQANDLGRARAALDQLLKERRDELPRLIGTCRGYLGDGAALEAVSTARKAEQQAAGASEKAEAAARLQQAVAQLLAAGDRQPALSLDPGYRQLKKLLGNLNDRIAAECARFNLQAAAYNRRIRRFPSSLVARGAGLKPQERFEVLRESTVGRAQREPAGRESP